MVNFEVYYFFLFHIILKMNLETIIGLEIHAQLSTKSKLWCSCDNNTFGAKPNSRICPVCTGFPGMLPILNKKSLNKAIRAALALGCKINKFSKFDRKNYFYPDLPNGYQITQNEEPFAVEGQISILVPDKIDKHGNSGKISIKDINITRVHIENDAGKLTHSEEGSFIDFNRSGSPLIEIVTEPELRSSTEAKALAQEIQKILRIIEASNADMEKGMMRFDASVSLRPIGEKTLYARAEIKNLNSFTSLQKAIEFEVDRQTKLWEKNTPPEKDSTRGWVESKSETKLLRSKESADDYRYFPEPDVPPLVFTDEEINEISRNLPELPSEKFNKYKNKYNLSDQDSLKLSESADLSEFFEESVKISNNPQKSAKFILSILLATENWQKTAIKPSHISDVINFLEKSIISSSGAKKILEEAIKTGKNAEILMTELGLEQISNTEELKKWVQDVIKNNPKTISDFKNGKEKVIGFLVGQVMKTSRGSANPELVQKLIKEELKNN